MSDQTRHEWGQPYSRGTLVVFSDSGVSDYLAALSRDFKYERFDWPEEPDFVKFYFFGVDARFARSQAENLFRYEWAWIPEWVKDIFKGKCGGDDCAHSKICAQPGCLCKKGKCR